MKPSCSALRLPRHNGRVNTPEEQRPEPATTPEQTPETPAGRRYRKALTSLTLALLLSWLFMSFPLPWSLVAGALGVVALVLIGVLAVNAWKDGRRGSMVIAVVFGLPAALMLIANSVVSAVFYGPTQEYQICMTEAMTERAKASCEQNVSDSTMQWVTGLFGG